MMTSTLPSPEGKKTLQSTLPLPGLLPIEAALGETLSMNKARAKKQKAMSSFTFFDSLDTGEKLKLSARWRPMSYSSFVVLFTPVDGFAICQPMFFLHVCFWITGIVFPIVAIGI